MRFDIITLFPDMFTPFLHQGVTRRAFEHGHIQVKLWQLRDFADDNYRRIDDRPFGGGPGMVMQAEPLYKCVQAIRAEHTRLELPELPLWLFSPAGCVLQHCLVQQWAQPDNAGAILICGRYEGIDQRFIDLYVDAQISLGNFVLSGGEIAAMALLDAIARLQPDVLNDAQSYQQDSFSAHIDGLLDCPHYTRPKVWQQHTVPDVLLSGDHAAIKQWRRVQSIEQTQKYRPDLLLDTGALKSKK